MSDNNKRKVVRVHTVDNEVIEGEEWLIDAATRRTGIPGVPNEIWSSKKNAYRER
jgi:hypothetical protein